MHTNVSQAAILFHTQTKVTQMHPTALQQLANTHQGKPASMLPNTKEAGVPTTYQFLPQLVHNHKQQLNIPNLTQLDDVLGYGVHSLCTGHAMEVTGTTAITHSSHTAQRSRHRSSFTGARRSRRDRRSPAAGISGGAAGTETWFGSVAGTGAVGAAAGPGDDPGTSGCGTAGGVGGTDREDGCGRAPSSDTSGRFSGTTRSSSSGSSS